LPAVNALVADCRFRRRSHEAGPAVWVSRYPTAAPFAGVASQRHWCASARTE